MSLEYIRKTYSVPAYRGALVLFDFRDGGGRCKGIITGSRGQYLRVRLENDPCRGPLTLHPTWNVEYLPNNPKGGL